MCRISICILLLMLCCLQSIRAQRKGDPVGTIYVTKQTPVHDPVIIKEQNVYYLFCTGFGISVFSSVDLKQWKKEPPVFAEAPKWAMEAVPGYKGHTWAPDISYHNGMYYLYYSVSTFGKNSSCIGVAVNKTLNPASPNFKWVDLGKVIQSVPLRDNWNAIDPNLILENNKQGWLSFGSFWSGIKMLALDSTLTKPATPQKWFAIAARPHSTISADTAAGNGAIEAPFIFKKGDYYYLFISWDYCCKAAKSNYKIMVGRSSNITGPYWDKNHKPLSKNGGTLVLQGDGKEWYGIGHNSVFTDADGTAYLVAHGYDVGDAGRAKLIIKKISWKHGWPTVD